MKLEKKDYAFALSAVFILIVLYIINMPSGTDIEEDYKPSPEPSASESVLPSPTPAKSGVIQTNKPELIAKELNDYDYWFNKMDSQNMVLGIYGECTYIVPSNLTYKNNTNVMLDNTRSTKDHVLKIGSTEYALKAGEWKITTLSSKQLPVRLAIFCEGIELGEIELK
jgi:hypothetical protein